MLHNWSRYTRENRPRELSILLCIFEARESFVSRPNKTGGDQEIASLIADVKRAIAQLAAAEGRLLFNPRRAFRTRLATREAAPRHKGTGGTRQMDHLAIG
jgi:hypothetical protein